MSYSTNNLFCAGDKAMMTTDSIVIEIEACKEVCTECQDICIETINYCKTLDSKSIDMGLMCMMRDCAEMCMMCVNMIVDGSEFMGRTCQLCAEICISTAMACKAMGNNAKLQHCASVCLQCAESCKTLGFKSSSYFRRENNVSLDSLKV
jgi:hypothetical protein